MNAVITFRCPGEISAALEERARAESRTRTGQILFYLRRGLGEDGGMPSVPPLPLTTDQAAAWALLTPAERLEAIRRECAALRELRGLVDDP